MGLDPMGGDQIWRGNERRNGDVIYGGYFELSRLEPASAPGSKAREAESFGLMTLDY